MNILLLLRNCFGRFWNCSINKRSDSITAIAMVAIALLVSSCSPVANQHVFDTHNSNAGPRLFIDKTAVDLGQIRTDKVINMDFLLANTGTVDLIIKEIKTSCGCTVPNIEAGTVIPSKDTKELLIRFNPEGYKGQVHHKVTLITNDEHKPEAVIKITGYAIMTHDRLAVAPKTINLGILRTSRWEKELLVRFPGAFNYSDVFCFSTDPHGWATILTTAKAPAIYDYNIKRIESSNFALVYVVSEGNNFDGNIEESVTIASKTGKFAPVTVPIVGYRKKMYELEPKVLYAFFPSRETVVKKHLVFYAPCGARGCEIILTNVPNGTDVKIKKVANTEERYDVYIEVRRKPGLLFNHRDEIEFKITCGENICTQAVSFITIG